MSFDALATAAMRDELRGTILHGRIQDVVLTDALGIGLEIYADQMRHYLYASAHARDARIQLVEAKLRRGPDSPTPLLLLLRKHARGGRITEITQPGFERILRLEISHSLGQVLLYVEIMGRHSNIILVNEAGRIMEAVKRVPRSLSRRVILPGWPYVPPPPQDKISLASLTPARLAAELGSVLKPHTPLWRGLVARVLAMSPLLAREIVHRTTGDAEATEAELDALLTIAGSMLELAQDQAWDPSVARDGGRIVAFAPYPLLQYADREAVPGISQAITLYYGQEQGPVDYAAARAGVGRAISAARARLMRRRDALRRSLGSDADMEELVRKGQLILAFGAQIRPGQRDLSVDLGTSEPVSIAIDPALSPSENAQRYFLAYDKLKGARQQVPDLLQEVEREVQFLEQLGADLEIATSRPEIDQVRSILIEEGYLHAKRPPRSPQSAPTRFQSMDGLLVLVGKNSRQNDQITFKAAKADDIWLHARQIPGSHVIICSEGGSPPPESTIRQAAETAAWYSRGRSDGQVDVDYTERRNVRRAPGGKPGQATVRHAKTIRVVPRDWPAASTRR